MNNCPISQTGKWGFLFGEAQWIKKMTELSLTQKLLHLVADDRFAKIESLAKRPNLFRIVGRTHTETWHSMFLGWLLDPKGSHNLGSFSLRRLLVAITNPTIIGSVDEIDKIAVFPITHIIKTTLPPIAPILKMVFLQTLI